jgi:hypothetical protein
MIFRIELGLAIFNFALFFFLIVVHDNEKLSKFFLRICLLKHWVLPTAWAREEDLLGMLGQDWAARAGLTGYLATGRVLLRVVARYGRVLASGFYSWRVWEHVVVGSGQRGCYRSPMVQVPEVVRPEFKRHSVFAAGNNSIDWRVSLRTRRHKLIAMRHDSVSKPIVRGRNGEATTREVSIVHRYSVSVFVFAWSGQLPFLF